MTRTLLRARRVFDGTGSVIDQGAVLISGTTIEAVGTAAAIGAPADVEVLDLGGATVLPGLIDVHNHITFPGDGRVVAQVLAHDTDGMLAQGKVTAAALLAAGITTVRDLGALGDTALRLAREIEAGRSSGPEILASTPQLTSVGGPNAALGGGCSDLAQAKERIDAALGGGARVVKVIATGSVTDTATDPRRPVFDDATLRGMVDHAHDAGVRVAAHAHGSAGIAQAARCGVDSIEHASFLAAVTTTDEGTGGEPVRGLTSWPDLDTLTALEEHRPWIVPTLAATFAHTQVVQATPASTRDLAHRMAIGRLLRERGLPLAAGTDGGGPGCPNLSLTVEIELLRALGMTSAQALMAATSQAADCLGLADRGTLAPGRRADLMVVSGNPLDSLDLLRAPTLVMLAGRIAHRFTQRPAPNPAAG